MQQAECLQELSMKIKTKFCKRCQTDQPRTNFFKSKTGKYGIAFYCKDCAKIINKDYVQRNRERVSLLNKKYRQEHKKEIAEYRKIYHQTPKRRFQDYKKRAKQKELQFQLSFDQFMSFWDKACSYCGKDFKGIGIDRIDSNQGYIINNCQSCCPICNKMKSNYDEKFFLDRIKLIYKHENIR